MRPLEAHLQGSAEPRSEKAQLVARDYGAGKTLPTGRTEHLHIHILYRYSLLSYSRLESEHRSWMVTGDVPLDVDNEENLKWWLGDSSVQDFQKRT